ncbi:ribosome silencing factor [Bilifractor sp. LCP21S3_A7]|jgi:ribosome-associated protein|uniref:ribosome silencing factor n=1 Tax=Bilifractor sp. LCP21S3_A7 TaxID=3438738 RepID=UPI003F90446C
MTEPREMADIAVKALEEKKAIDIKIIDISHISTLADYFIIASGSNRSQVQAMADAVDEALDKTGVHARSTEGYQNANWILLDYGDIVVHLFDEENRLFYDLERIWRDGRVISPETLEDGSGSEEQ